MSQLRADHSSREVLPSVVCLTKYDRGASIMKKPCPTRGCWAMEGKTLIMKCCCFNFSLVRELQGKAKRISVKLVSEYTYTSANQSPISVKMITTEWGSQFSDAFYGLLSGQSGTQEGLTYSAMGNRISGNTARYWLECRKADIPFTTNEYLFRWMSSIVSEYRKEY